MVTLADSFQAPRGLAWDGDGTIFVADQAGSMVYSFPSGRLVRAEPRDGLCARQTAGPKSRRLDFSDCVRYCGGLEGVQKTLFGALVVFCILFARRLHPRTSRVHSRGSSARMRLAGLVALALSGAEPDRVGAATSAEGRIPSTRPKRRASR